MIIEDRPTKSLTFEDLQVGETFFTHKDRSDRVLLMKCKGPHGSLHNAARLDIGVVFPYNPTTQVVKVDAKVVIS